MNLLDPVCSDKRQDSPGMVQKTLSRRWHVVMDVIGAQGFECGSLFTLDATPLNISNPDGFYRRWCIGKFLLSEVERRHVDDPFS